MVSLRPFLMVHYHVIKSTSDQNKQDIRKDSLIFTRGKIQQQDTTILNTFAPNTIALTFI